MKLFRQWFEERFQQLHSVITDPTLSVFLLSVGYHLALYLSTSNTTLLIFTAIYAGLLYKKTTSIGQTLLLVFLTTLPFAKGKGYQIILLPHELVPRYSLFKISYFFPLYLSDFILCLSIAWHFRNRFFQRAPLPPFTRGLKILLGVQLALTVYALMHVALSPWREVIFLSAVQLFKMIFILVLPFMARLPSLPAMRNRLIEIVTASLLFQSAWALLQALTGGPLGKHIEAVLPGFDGGIVASETGDLMRVNGTFYEPSILGTFLAMNILLLMAARRLKWGLPKSLHPISTSAIVLASIALIFTGSRGLYLITLALAGLMWKNELRWQAIKTWVKRNAVALVFVALVVGNYLQARAATVTDMFTRYGTASYRIAMLEYAARIGLNAPWGVGTNISPYTLATGFGGEQYVFDPTYPHNIFAQVFAELGLPGVLLLLAFILVFIREGRRLNSPFFYPALIFFAAAQLYPIFINHQEILGFFYLFVGLTFWSSQKTRKHAET